MRLNGKASLHAHIPTHPNCTHALFVDRLVATWKILDFPRPRGLLPASEPKQASNQVFFSKYSHYLHWRHAWTILYLYFFSFIFILYLINYGAEGQIPCWCVQTNKGDSYTIMNCLFLFTGCKKLRLPPISDGKLQHEFPANTINVHVWEVISRQGRSPAVLSLA